MEFSLIMPAAAKNMRSTKLVPLRSLQMRRDGLCSPHSLSKGLFERGDRLISLSHNPVLRIGSFSRSALFFFGHAARRTASASCGSFAPRSCLFFLKYTKYSCEKNSSPGHKISRDLLSPHGVPHARSLLPRGAYSCIFPFFCSLFFDKLNRDRHKAVEKTAQICQKFASTGGMD